MPLLEVTDLVVGLDTARGPANAVRGVSFTLPPGGTLGIVGESGSGKTLTALSLMGLLPDNARASGSIRLDGRELMGLDEADFCKLRGDRIGMIFQEPMTALNPLHRIGQQVAEPLVVHRGMRAAEARSEAIRLIERVGIPEPGRRAQAYPYQLSGGQRQRVTIAMALACGPSLLVADEPTTALDVTIQRQILDLIGELVDETGMALVMISHDLGVIAETAETMIVMYGGTIVESGPTASIFARPAHPYTQGLLAARPKLGAGKGVKLKTIPGTVPDILDLPHGCAFAGRCALTIDACRTAPPPPALVDAGHFARCIRLDVALDGR